MGKFIHIERRWQEHCQNSSYSLIGKAIKKYGKENFSFQILEEISDLNKLNELETQYILSFNSLNPNGYNLVISDNQQHHQFVKYNQNIFLEIIDKIKNSDLSFKEIAKLYDLDLSMIYYLNRGDYHSLPNEKYPLREVKDFSKKIYYCIDCGCEISKNSLRCSKCDHLKQRKVTRPTREELKCLIRSKPFTQIGKEFNVSDSAIRKWCKAEKLPFKSSDIKKYTKDEWEKI